MTTTSLDPIAVDQQHVLQVYRRAPVVFVSGRGCALFSREGDRYLDLISGIGVAALGHAPSCARARNRGSGRHVDPHVQSVPSPLAGRARAAALGPVRPAAGVLLQQRRGSGRGLPEVCAPVLARGRRLRADTVRRAPALVPWTDDGRAVGDVGRALPDAVRTARERGDVRARRRRQGGGGRDHEGYSRGGRRADTRRRRRATAATRHRKCDCGGVPQHRDAPHRRRNPVRSRTYRASVSLGHAWPAAGPDGTRQGAGRRRADRCGADVGKGRRERAARGSRQHIRRQPAGVPRGDCLRRRVGERRSHAERRPGGCASRGGFARDRHSTAGREGRSRCRPDVGNRIGSSGRSRRSGGARAQAARQPDVRHGDSSAAAVRHHRTGNRRGFAAPGSGD